MTITSFFQFSHETSLVDVRLFCKGRLILLECEHQLRIIGPAELLNGISTSTAKWSVKRSEFQDDSQGIQMLEITYVDRPALIKKAARFDRILEFRKNQNDPPIIDTQTIVTSTSVELFRRPQVEEFSEGKRKSFFAQLRIRRRKNRRQVNSDRDQHKVATISQRVGEFITGATGTIAQCIITGDPFEYESSPYSVEEARQTEQVNRLVQRIEERRHLPIDVIGALNIIDSCNRTKIPRNSKSDLNRLIGAQNILISQNLSLQIPDSTLVVKPIRVLEAISKKFNVSLKYIQSLQPKDTSLYGLGGTPHLFCHHPEPS